MHPFSSSPKNVGTKCRYLKVQNLIRFTCQHDIKAVGTFLPFLMMTRPFSRFYLIKKNLLSATIGHLNHGTCLMPDGAQHQFHRAINASMNTILAKSTYILTRVEILCTLCYKIGLNSVFIVELHEKNDYISCISDLLLRLLQLGNLDKIRLHFAI